MDPGSPSRSRSSWSASRFCRCRGPSAGGSCSWRAGRSRSSTRSSLDRSARSCFGLLALGWRWFDRPAWLGITGALGAAIKIQPGLVLVWAVLTGRWRAAAIGAVTLVVLAVLATLLAGVGAWSDFLTLLRTVSDPITTEHNFTPGAVAFQLGVPADAAALIQLASTVAVVVILIAAVRFATDEASYLMTVVASQLVSPILWDHYAMLLLLPVAFLLSAGRWWAALIPLATAWPLVGLTPPVIYRSPSG